MAQSDQRAKKGVRSRSPRAGSERERMEDRATLSLSENGLNFPLHPLGNLSAGKSLPRPLPPQGLQPRKKASEQRERERGTGERARAGRWPTPPMGRADTRSQHRSGIQTNNLFNTIAGKKAGKLRRKWLARAGTFLFRKDIFFKIPKNKTDSAF